MIVGTDYFLGFQPGEIGLCREGYNGTECVLLPSPLLIDLLLIAYFSAGYPGTGISGIANSLLGIGSCTVCAEGYCLPASIIKIYSMGI